QSRCRVVAPAALCLPLQVLDCDPLDSHGQTITRLQVEVSQTRPTSDSCVFTTASKLTYTQSLGPVAMAGDEALLRQLLQNQTQILARLVTVDEKLEKLRAGQDQLSMELHETRKAQNDLQSKWRPCVHIFTTQPLLEMILLELDECPDEESRVDESDDESDNCDEYTGRLFDAKIHKQVLGLRTILLARRVSRGFQATIDRSKKLQRALFFTPEPPTYASDRLNWLYLVTQVCHGLFIKCDADPEARPQLTLEARPDSEAWCHIMFDIEDISNLPGKRSITLEMQPYVNWGRVCRCTSLDLDDDDSSEASDGCNLHASLKPSSWMNMYFSQPPVEVHWKGDSYFRKALPETLSESLPRHPTTISSIFSDASATVSVEGAASLTLYGGQWCTNGMQLGT
ncbi:hypothetical protein D0869_15216, partial [Hortaea werneckii]